MLDRNKFPLAVKHQINLWRDTIAKEYLWHRTAISTRQIEWHDLTIDLAVRTTKQADPRQVAKLIYDKYSNSQYGERTNNCPICKSGPDIRAHLYRCTHPSALAIIRNVGQSLEQEPFPEQLHQDVMLSSQQLLTIKRCIVDLIQ